MDPSTWWVDALATPSDTLPHSLTLLRTACWISDTDTDDDLVAFFQQGGAYHLVNILATVRTLDADVFSKEDLDSIEMNIIRCIDGIWYMHSKSHKEALLDNGLVQALHQRLVEKSAYVDLWLHPLIRFMAMDPNVARRMYMDCPELSTSLREASDSEAAMGTFAMEDLDEVCATLDTHARRNVKGVSRS